MYLTVKITFRFPSVPPKRTRDIHGEYLGALAWSRRRDRRSRYPEE
jgi:hypothetical protein